MPTVRPKWYKLRLLGGEDVRVAEDSGQLLVEGSGLEEERVAQRLTGMPSHRLCILETIQELLSSGFEMQSIARTYRKLMEGDPWQHHHRVAGLVMASLADVSPESVACWPGVLPTAVLDFLLDAHGSKERVLVVLSERNDLGKAHLSRLVAINGDRSQHHLQMFTNPAVPAGVKQRILLEVGYIAHHASRDPGDLLPELQETLAFHPDPTIRRQAANSRMPAEMLDRMVTDRDRDVRKAAASCCSELGLAKLLGDRDPEVRLAAANNPSLTALQRQKMLAGVGL